MVSPSSGYRASVAEFERRGPDLIVRLPDGEKDWLVEAVTGELERDRELQRVIIRVTAISGPVLEVIRAIRTAAERRGLSVDWWV